MPPPTAYRHEELYEGIQVASDASYEATTGGQASGCTGAPLDERMDFWTVGVEDEWTFVCEICGVSGEGTPTRVSSSLGGSPVAQSTGGVIGEAELQRWQSLPMQAELLADGYRLEDMKLTKATVPATEQQVRAAPVALTWPIRLARSMILGSAVRRFMSGEPKSLVLDEIDNLPAVVRINMVQRKNRWWMLVASNRCTHRGISDRVGHVLAHMDDRKPGLYIAFASKLEARCCWRMAFPESGEPPIVDAVCSVPKPEKKGKVFPTSKPPLPMRIETAEGA